MASSSKAEGDWWELYPSLYQAELAAFERHGATWSELAKRRGLLVLDVSWPTDNGERLALRVGFSPLHPFSRPSVAAPDLHLDRHQNPFSRGLCLITQEGDQWDPSSPVADHIGAQLPQVLNAVALRAAESWADAGAIEEQAPDPLSVYYQVEAEPFSAVFYGRDQRVPLGRYGLAEFEMQPRPVIRQPQPFEAILRSAMPMSGAWLAPKFAIPQSLGSWERLPGRWVRMQPPTTLDALELLRTAEREVAAHTAISARERLAWNKVGEAPISVTAVRLPEEVVYGADGMGEGWLFLVARREGRGKLKANIVRGLGISDDMFSRVPIASGLRTRKALVVGCGAIGSFVALELARAGIGRLCLFDKDILEPGNSVRWALGRGHWGWPKAHALQAHMRREYPWTTVDVAQGTLGGTSTDPADADEVMESPVTQLRRMIQDVDVVVDTTASLECQHALAFHCRDLGTPLVIGYGTEGAAGGVVIRLAGDSEFCLVCLSHHWKDGGLPVPAVDSAGTVLPIGCNAPTFTGGAFDLQEVSMEVVRTAMELASSGADERPDWDVAVLSHRNGGRRILPRWVGQRLLPHARCSCRTAE